METARRRGTIDGSNAGRENVRWIGGFAFSSASLFVKIFVEPIRSAETTRCDWLIAGIALRWWPGVEKSKEKTLSPRRPCVRTASYYYASLRHCQIVHHLPFFGLTQRFALMSLITAAAFSSQREGMRSCRDPSEIAGVILRQSFCPPEQDTLRIFATSR